MNSSPTITRKDFLTKNLATVTGLLLLPDHLTAQQQEKPVPIASEIVNEFVKVAHSNLDRVKVMLEEFPLLLNSAWDWGGGDFETAIGAAGHMGLKETANYLLDKGARTDLFVLTMLGKTAIVKATLKEYPKLLNSVGPHGFTLLHHAEKGGKEGEELFIYLQSLGLNDKHRKLY